MFWSAQRNIEMVEIFCFSCDDPRHSSGHFNIAQTSKLSVINAWTQLELSEGSSCVCVVCVCGSRSGHAVPIWWMPKWISACSTHELTPSATNECAFARTHTHTLYVCKWRLFAVASIQRTLAICIWWIKQAIWHDMMIFSQPRDTFVLHPFTGFAVRFMTSESNRPQPIQHSELDIWVEVLRHNRVRVYFLGGQSLAFLSSSNAQIFKSISWMNAALLD